MLESEEQNLRPMTSRTLRIAAAAAIGAAAIIMFAVLDSRQQPAAKDADTGKSGQAADQQTANDGPAPSLEQLQASIIELQKSLKDKERLLAHEHANFLAELAATAKSAGDPERWLRFAVHGARLDQVDGTPTPGPSIARAELRRAVQGVDWMYRFQGLSGPLFSPDGTKAAVANDDMQLWATDSNRKLAQKAYAGTIYELFYSPDGTKIAATTNDNAVHLFSAAAGLDELVALRGHADLVATVAFNRSGDRILTSSSDKTARVWEASTGRSITVLKGHTGSVTSAAYSPDDTKIVTASSDTTARVWEASTGRVIVILRGHTGELRSAAFSPDGSKIITVSGDDQKDPTVRVWSAGNGKQLYVLREAADKKDPSTAAEYEPGFEQAQFSPDGSKILTVGTGLIAAAKIWDALTGKQISVLPNGGLGGTSRAVFIENGAKAVTYNLNGDAPGGDTIVADPDGRQIAFLRGREDLDWVWDRRGNPENIISQAMPRHINFGTRARFSTDRSKLVLTADINTRAPDKGPTYQHSLWDIKTRQRVAILQADHSDDIALSPDGAFVITGVGDDAVVWDANSGRETARLRGQVLYDAPFSRDGHRVVTTSKDKSLKVWEIPSGRQIGAIEQGNNIVSVAALSPDGNRVVAGYSDGAARVWDVSSGREIANVRADEYDILSVRFAPDGRRILTVATAAQIWDADTGRPISKLSGAENASDFLFSADGSKLLARGAPFFRTLIWDTVTGEQVGVLPISNAADFSHDGRRIVTASNGGGAIWDTDTGRELATLSLKQGALSAMFNPDDSTVMVVSDDGMVRIWDVHRTDLPLSELLHDACTNRLRGATTLSREEMRLAGYPNSMPEIDVCDGVR